MFKYWIRGELQETGSLRTLAAFGRGEKEGGLIKTRRKPQVPFGQSDAIHLLSRKSHLLSSHPHPRAILAPMSNGTLPPRGPMAHEHDHGQDAPSDLTLRVKALESLLVEKGLVDPAALDAIVDTYEHKIGPRNGTRVVAKAWGDPGV